MGEKSTGPNPTDRSKLGTKRSLLVDGQGIPPGITIDSANIHDMKMTKTATLLSIVVCRLLPSTNTQQQHICLDKGYDYPEVYELKNMVIPYTFAKEEKITIIITKRRKGYQNTE